MKSFWVWFGLLLFPLALTQYVLFLCVIFPQYLSLSPPPPPPLHLRSPSSPAVSYFLSLLFVFTMRSCFLTFLVILWGLVWWGHSFQLVPWEHILHWAILNKIISWAFLEHTGIISLVCQFVCSLACHQTFLGELFLPSIQHQNSRLTNFLAD